MAPVFREAAGALSYESVSRYRLFECSELVLRSAAKGAVNVMASAGKMDQVLEEAGPLKEKARDSRS